MKPYLAVLVLALSCFNAYAQNCPNRTVQIVVLLAPGAVLYLASNISTDVTGTVPRVYEGIIW